MGCLVFYAFFYFNPHIENEYSSAQSHDYWHHPFSSPLWKHLPPSLASTLQCCKLLWGSSLSLLFLGDILAPPGLSSLLHNVICNGPKTFLDSAHHHFYLSLSSGLINWAGQVESNIPHIIKMKPLFEQLLSKK